MRMIVLGRML